MKKAAIFPGTFDPFTLGHKSIVEAALKLFDEVIISVATQHDRKKSLFTLAKRKAMLETIFASNKAVIVTSFSGLLVAHAKEIGVPIIIRGLRGCGDVEYEFNMATINQRLYPEIETVFLKCQPNQTFISASLLKEIAFNGGDVSLFLDPVVVEALSVKTQGG